MTSKSPDVPAPQPKEQPPEFLEVYAMMPALQRRVVKSLIDLPYGEVADLLSELQSMPTVKVPRQ